jgi:hypothetical protein
VPRISTQHSQWTLILLINWQWIMRCWVMNSLWLLFAQEVWRAWNFYLKNSRQANKLHHHRRHFSRCNRITQLSLIDVQRMTRHESVKLCIPWTHVLSFWEFLKRFSFTSAERVKNLILFDEIQIRAHCWAIIRQFKWQWNCFVNFVGMKKVLDLKFIFDQ